MSSHHIVRDAQEPALVIAGDFPLAHTEALLEWSPVVVVLEHCLAEVLTWEIKIDVVVGSFEQISFLTQQLEHQFPVEIIPDENDALKAALTYLYTHQHRAANIIGQMPTPIRGHFSEKMTLTFYQNGYKYILPSEPYFKKWVATGTQFLIDVSVNVNALEVHNLQIQNKHWQAIESGFVEIHHLPMHKWIGEKIW